MLVSSRSLQTRLYSFVDLQDISPQYDFEMQAAAPGWIDVDGLGVVSCGTLGGFVAHSRHVYPFPQTSPNKKALASEFEK